MNLQKCGTISILVLALLCIISSSEAASKKKKRVIVKVPARIKHIYHHHTKNLHIHKPKSTKSASYDSPRNRPPVPYSGGKKRKQPWREEKNYDDYYDDEYDYGNYGNGGRGGDRGKYKEDRGKYKDDRGRWKDDYRGGGYDYEPPKRGRWRAEESKRTKGYSGYSKRSPQWKNSRRNPSKKPHRDMYEGAGTAPWPEVKEHDSWHQPRPQGFQQNTRIIPSDQYHDTSIHAIDYTDKQSSNIHPSVASLDRPSYEAPPSFDRLAQLEHQPSNIRPSFERPSVEPLYHPPPPDYEAQSSNIHPVAVEPNRFAQPTDPYPVQPFYDHSQSFQPQIFQPHSLQ